MKLQRKAAAAAVAGVLGLLPAAHAQSSVTLYGLLDIGVSYVNNNGGGSRTAVDSGIWQASRLGFRGTEDLGGGMSALYVLEAGVNMDTGAGSVNGALAFNRQSYVGLTGDWGTVTLGRQYDFLYTTSLGLGSERFIGGLAAGVGGAPLDTHLGGVRYDNSIKWQRPLGPVTVGLMHGFGLEGSVAADTKSVNAALLAYREGPLAIGYGWTQDDYNAANSGNTANKVGALKGSYSFGKFIFSGIYANASSRNTRTSNKPVELALAYSPVETLTVGIAVGRAKVTNAVGAGASVSQVSLGAVYYLSKGSVLYAMVANNRSDNAAVYRAFVGTSGGASVASSDGSQSVVRLGIARLF